MNEKEPIKISLSTLFLILALIVIIVLVFYIFSINNKNRFSKENLNNLNNKISSLENTISKLESEKNTTTSNIESNKTTFNTVSSNSNSNENTNNASSNIEKNNSTSQTDKITKIEGEYFPVIEGPNDAPSYIFYSNGKVESAGNYTLTGTYEIKDNIIKIKLTTRSGPDAENEKINEEDTLTIVDNKTLLDTEYNTKYVKK